MPDTFKKLDEMAQATKPQIASRIVTLRGAAHESVPVDSVMATPYDARLYGVPADGVTDASAAIQAALNAAGVVGSTSVYLPSGTFRLTTALNIPAGVTLCGNQSILTRATPSNSALILVTASNSGLREIIVDGTYTANSDAAELGFGLIDIIGATDATSVKNIQIHDITVRRSRACGIRVVGNIDGLIIKNCFFESTFCSVFATYYSLSSTTIYRNLSIIDNHFLPNWGTGNFSGAVKLVSDDSLGLVPNGLHVVGNQITDCGQMGVEIWKLAKNCIIALNHISGCDHAISVDKVSASLIQSNHCTRYVYAGIEIAQACDDILVEGNLCIGYNSGGARAGSACLVVSGDPCTNIRIKGGMYIGSNKGMQIQQGLGVEIDNASITDCGDLLFLQGSDKVWAHNVKLHGPCYSHLGIDCVVKNCTDIDIDGCVFTGAAVGNNIVYYDLGAGRTLTNLRIHNCNAIDATWGNLSINKAIPLDRTPNIRCYDNYFIGGGNKADFSAFSDATATPEPFAPSLQKSGISVAGKSTITAAASGSTRWARILSVITGNVVFTQAHFYATNTTTGDSGALNVIIAGAPYGQGASITALPETQFGGIIEEIIYNNNDATHEIWVRLKPSALAWTVSAYISDYPVGIIAAPTLITTEPTWMSNHYRLQTELGRNHLLQAPALFARDVIASAPRGAIAETAARLHIRGPGASGLAATRVARFDKADGAEAFGVKADGETLAKLGLAVGDDGHTYTVKRLLSNLGTLDWGTINAGAELTLNLYVAGVLPTNNPAVCLGWVTMPPAGILVRAAQVNPSSETVSISLLNYTGSNIAVGNLTVRATVFQY